MPPGFESDYFSIGRHIDVFDYCGLRIATLIRYDAEFPGLARQAALRGADIILVPTMLAQQWGWVANQIMPTRGFENEVFLAFANHAGTENGLSYLCASFIAAPGGEMWARAGATAEVITAKIAKSRVKDAQNRLPYHRDDDKIQLDDNAPPSADMP